MRWGDGPRHYTTGQWADPRITTPPARRTDIPDFIPAPSSIFGVVE